MGSTVCLVDVVWVSEYEETFEGMSIDESSLVFVLAHLESVVSPSSISVCCKLQSLCQLRV